MNNINLNILILGKTGAGKSSLINYLTSQNLLKTGEGKPVTGQDFETITYNTGSVNLTFIDSWGLEANKAFEWKRLVFDKLENGIEIPTENNNIFSKKVFSIIYCINYKSSRIEDFELNFLQELLKTKQYKILILFTQADNIATEKRKDFTEVINSNLADYTDFFTIQEACAKKIQLLGQSTATKTFGKKEIIETLGKNLWQNLVNYAINSWYNYSKNLINDFDQETRLYIKKLNAKKKKLILFYPKLVRANHCIDKMEKQLNKVQTQITSQLQLNIKSALDYYEQLFEKTHSISEELYNTYVFIRNKYDSYDFVAAFVIDCIPILGQLFMLVKGSILKDELLAEQKKCIESLNQLIYEKTVFLENELIYKQN